MKSARPARLPGVNLRAAGFANPENTQTAVPVRRDRGADAALPAGMTAEQQRDRRQQRHRGETDDAPHGHTLPTVAGNSKLNELSHTHLAGGGAGELVRVISL